MFTGHNIPSFNTEDTLPPTPKMSTSEASPFPRPKGTKLPPFQDHFCKSVPLFKTIGAKAIPPLQGHHQKPCPSKKNGISHFHEWPEYQPEMLQSLQQCPHNYIKLQIKKNLSPHHKNDRQYHLTLSSYRYHCLSTNIEANKMRSPSEITRSPSEMSRQWSQETTTTTYPHNM